MQIGSPIIGLAVLGVALGVGMLLVFRWTSKPEAIRRAKARMMAHLYEMRLFADEPALIWSAQGGLLKANARYLGLMLLPAVVMSVPMIALFSWLDCYYGYRPLQPGTSGILTVQLKHPLAGVAPVLRGPDGVTVETEGVRLESKSQISWRIRAVTTAAGKFQIVFPDETIEKSVDAGAAPRLISSRRVSSVEDFFWHPAERPLTSDRVDWIEIRYPRALVAGAGFELPWIVWLLLFSIAAALGLKRQFGATF